MEGRCGLGPGSGVGEFLITGIGAVAGFAAVAFGHPDSLDGLAVGKGEQIADGSVGGRELFFNYGLADGELGVNELLAEGQGQGGELIEARPPLAIESVQ